MSCWGDALKAAVMVVGRLSPGTVLHEPIFPRGEESVIRQAKAEGRPSPFSGALSGVRPRDGDGGGAVGLGQQSWRRTLCGPHLAEEETEAQGGSTRKWWRLSGSVPRRTCWGTQGAPICRQTRKAECRNRAGLFPSASPQVIFYGSTPTSQPR